GTHNWAIVNEDLAPMPLGATFNVLVEPPNYPNVFQFSDLGGRFPHGVAGWQGIGPLSEAGLEINNTSVTDGRPDLVLVVTHLWNPGTAWDPHLLGVFYDDFSGNWYILHEDGTPIPPNVTYNVLIGSPSSLRHTAAPSNIGPGLSFITTLD